MAQSAIRGIQRSIGMFLSLLACSCAGSKIKPGEPDFIPLEYSYRIFKKIPETSIIQFQDSHTLSHEVIQAELAIMDRLYLDRGFDLLALESSPFETWLAMDGVLNERSDSEAVKQARLRAMSDRYQTEESEEIFKWVRDYRKREDPLYAIGFLPRFGTTYAWRNQFLLRQFAKTLVSYGLKRDPTELESALENLLNLKDCARTGESVLGSIGVLRSWVKEAVPFIDGRFPNVPHGNALLLIPDALQAELDLCGSHDLAAAESRLISKGRSQVSKTGKVIILQGLSPEAEVIRQTLSRELNDSRVFTIGSFPVAGDLLVPGPPPKKQHYLGHETILQRSFKGLKKPIFLNLSEVNPSQKRLSGLFRHDLVLVEGKTEELSVSGRFDALLMFPRYTPSKKWFLDHLMNPNAIR